MLLKYYFSNAVKLFKNELFLASFILFWILNENFIVYVFAGFFLTLLNLLYFINSERKDFNVNDTVEKFEEEKVLADLHDFKRFNPCSHSVGSTRLTTWRFSAINLCPSSFLPPTKGLFMRLGYEMSRVLIELRRHGLEQRRFLNTLDLGPGSYEDPRVFLLSEKYAAIVMSKLYYTQAFFVFALLDLDSKSFEKPVYSKQWYHSKEFQKNWIIDVESNTISLYANIEKDIRFTITDVTRKTGHEKEAISSVPLPVWRGSGNLMTYRGFKIGLAHRRLKSKVEERFLPNYDHSFFVKTRTISYGCPFTVSIEGFDNAFVYLSGFEVTEHYFTLYAGILDCYALSFQLDLETVERLLCSRARTHYHVNEFVML